MFKKGFDFELKLISNDPNMQDVGNVEHPPPPAVHFRLVYTSAGFIIFFTKEQKRTGKVNVRHDSADKNWTIFVKKNSSVATILKFLGKRQMEKNKTGSTFHCFLWLLLRINC